MTRILQKRLTKPAQDICLTDDDFIVVTIKRVLSEVSFKLDLRDFKPESSRQKAYGEKPVAACIIFMLLFIASGFAVLNEQDPTQRGAHLFAAGCTGVLLLFSIGYAWLSRTDVLVYFNRHSDKPWLTLYHGIPDKKAFAAFVNGLNDRLRKLNPRNGPASASAAAQRPLFSLN